jgi:hypothetical protein
MKDLASKLETLRRASGEISHRALAIGGIVLLVLAFLSSLIVFHGTDKPSAQPFNIVVLARPRSEAAALRAAAGRTSIARHCVEIAVETTKARQPVPRGVREIPLHKLLCTDPNGSVSVLAIATFTTKRQALSVIGSGNLADYDAATLFRTIEAAARGARPSVSQTSAPEQEKISSANGTTMTIKNLSTSDCPGAVKAGSEQKAALLKIANQSSRSIDVDQVDANGDRARYASIPPALSLSISTFVTQPWILSVNSICLTVVIARPGTGNITLR